MYSGRWFFEGEHNYQCFIADVEVDGAQDVREAVEQIMQAGFDRAHQIMDQVGDLGEAGNQWTWIDVFGECSLPFLADYGISWETYDILDDPNVSPESADEVFDPTQVIFECDGTHVWSYVQMAMPN